MTKSTRKNNFKNLATTATGFTIFFAGMCLGAFILFLALAPNKAHAEVPALLARPAPVVKAPVVKAPEPVKRKVVESDYIIPLDGYATIMGRLKDHPEVVNEMVVYVRAYQYRCDTISEAKYSGNTFTLKCNKYRYHYEIVDRGGKFVVRYVE